MRIVKASTALGKRLIKTGQQREGTFLNQVYDKWSAEKKRKHVTNVMMNIVIQRVLNSSVFVYIIVIALRFHGLHIM